MQDKIIKKWRESLIDPYEINFKKIKIIKIISYPYAGNDVFECKGYYNKIITHFYLKIERSKMANFDNEVYILNKLKKRLPVPLVYENGIYKNSKYIVLSKKNGNKLSTIFNNDNELKNIYLFNYGQCLAKLHQQKIKTDIATQRIINDYPKKENYGNFTFKEKEIINYLVLNKPDVLLSTFIHGDFHYGNILFKSKIITAILDWEYSGLGFKEQDIAWSIILRPEQKFFKTIKDIKMFLKGYKSKGNYEFEKLKWCLINGYLHFYLMNKNSKKNKYLASILKLINIIMKYEEL